MKTILMTGAAGKDLTPLVSIFDIICTLMYTMYITDTKEEAYDTDDFYRAQETRQDLF